MNPSDFKILRYAQNACAPHLRRASAAVSGSETGLFHRHALSKVPGLINVAAALEGHIIGEELQGHHAQRGLHNRVGLRYSYDAVRRVAIFSLKGSVASASTSAPRAFTSTTLLMALSKSGS